MFIRHYHDVELEQFEREAGLAINANSELFQTDPSSLSKDQIDKTKSLTFQAGKLAHSSKRISAPVRAYWEAHFLIATAMIDGHFLKDYQTSVNHLREAAAHLEQLESQYGYDHPGIHDSIEKLGSIHHTAISTYIGAASTMGMIDPNLSEGREIALKSNELLDPLRYPVDVIFPSGISIAMILIGSAKEAEDFAEALAPIGTAMNRLTGSMEIGSRPYHAIRQFEDAAMLYDLTLIAACGAGMKEYAMELHDKVDFEEVSKPWRFDQTSQVWTILECHKKILEDCPINFYGK
jgi:hypothetical protein